MLKAYLRINSLDDILEINKVSSLCDYKMAIYKGVQAFNPKSLIILLELGIGKVVPLVAKIYNNEDKADFLKKFRKFIVKYEYY